MTDKQMKLELGIIPTGEKVVKTYTAFEGDFRIITKDTAGVERRYTVRTDGGAAYLVQM